MLNDILGEMFRKTRKPTSSIKSVRAIGASALGFSFSITKGNETIEYGFRHTLMELMDEAKEGAAVIFLIDEANNDTLEIRELATTYQHLIRERQNVALLMAGLPHEVYSILNDLVFRQLSEKDKEFVHAMSKDANESQFATITDRLGVQKGYASKYRERMIKAGVVYLSGYGKLSFTLPFVREYLKRQF